MGISYLVRGASLKCICGSKTASLNLPVSHGSYIRNDPMIQEEDCKPIINIPSFGICSITGTPCVPVINGKWLCAHKDTKVNGKSAVTTDSAVFCSVGSLILPEESGQKEIMELLASLPEEELLNLLNGLKTCSPYSKDPVNLCTGNFVFEKEDIREKGTFPIVFKRTYNSVDNRCGMFGKHWTHNYEIFLKDQGDKIEILKEDGCIETYYKQLSDVYAPIGGIRNSLKKTDKEYILETASYSKYIFDANGRCTSLTDVNGNMEHYEYFHNKLMSIANSNGKLTFSYDETGRICSIKGDSGKVVNYTYNAEGELETISDTMEAKWEYKYNKMGFLKEIVNPLGTSNVKNIFDELGRTTKQIFPDGGVMSFKYEDENERVILTEQNGNCIKYYHNEKFLNVRTVYSDGYELFEYNDQNQRTGFRDKNGNWYNYEYDSLGKLILERNPLGHEYKIQYDRDGKPIKEIGFDNSVYLYDYDKKSQLRRRTDPLGNETSYEYNERGLVKQITFPDHSSFCLEFDKRNNIIAITDSMGSKISYCYDEKNQVIQSIDGNGNKTEYEYDTCGNLVKVTNADKKQREFCYNQVGKIIKVLDYNGTSVKTKYNTLNKVSQIINQEGHKTTFEYDKMWNIVKRTEANGGSVEFEYNKLNQLKKVTNGLGASILYEYDSNGNLVKEFGAADEVYLYKYNELNRNIEIEDPYGGKTYIDYDVMGRVVKTTDAKGMETRFEYNLLGDKTLEVDALGNEVHYEYNEMGLISKLTDQVGGVTSYEYYLGGYLSKVSFPDGTHLKYTYDNNKNVISQENQAGYRIDITYDSLNRIVRIIDSFGADKVFEYDEIGQVISVTDGNGNCTRYDYSPSGNLIKVTDALGTITECDYDELGNVVSLSIDPQYSDILTQNKEQKDRQQTLYIRNKLGQVEKIIDSLGHDELFHYNNAGKLLKKIDKEGYETSYNYTKTGEISEIKYADGKTVKYSYNMLRQLTAMEDWIGLTKIELDEIGRTKGITDHKDRKVTYIWGRGDKLKKIKYPDGTEVEYEYDKANRLCELREDNNIIYYSYDKNGFRKSREVLHGPKTTYLYDSMGKLTKLEHESQGKILEKFQYEYDATGNKTRISKYRDGLHSESGLYEYQYDSLNRLTAVNKDKVTIRNYEYDSKGNRLSFTDNGEKTRFYYNSLNQLIRAEGGLGHLEYQYDNRGNLIRLLEEGELSKLYEFDPRNKLTKSMNTRGEMTTYAYNAMGYNIEKNQGTSKNKEPMQVLYRNKDYVPYKGAIQYLFQPKTKTEYILDMRKSFDHLLAQEVNGISQRYIWDESPVMAKDHGGVSYYCQDDLDSTLRFIRPDTSNIAYGYDEYGNDLYNNQGLEQPFGYTGYRYDGEDTLYFAQARFYDSKVGRFFGEDMFKGVLYEPKTLNYYMYCAGNPLRYTDPSGNWTEAQRKEGIEAHFLLQKAMEAFYRDKVITEMPISNYPYSPSGNGFSDIVIFTDPNTATVYEIKHISNYSSPPPRVPVGVRATNGRQQREGYMQGLSAMGYTVNPAAPPIIPYGLKLPSITKPNKDIKYYVYPNDPGMIYYQFVNKDPKPEPQPEAVKVKEKEKEKIGAWARVGLGVAGVGATIYALWALANDVTVVGVVDDAAGAAAAVAAFAFFTQAFTGEREVDGDCIQ